MKFLSFEEREQIGFTFLMDELQIITPYGKDEKKQLKSFKPEERVKLLEELNKVEKFTELLNNKGQAFKGLFSLLTKVRDIRNTVKRCSQGAVLDDVELYEIKSFALLIDDITHSIENIGIHEEEFKLFSLEKVISLLDPEEKRIPTFYIYDDYSDELKAVRKEKRDIEDRMYKEGSEQALKKLKNIRLDIVTREEEEEKKIRIKISKRLQEHAALIEKDIKIIGRLDFVMAKAELAMRFNGIKPEICEESRVLFSDMFNPEVCQLLKQKGRGFLPVSLELKSGVTVITGANMAGKSVTLRTLVLNALLGSMGFFVFCSRAVMPVFDFIYIVSQDLQNVSQGLSSFGAEIIKLKDIVQDVEEGRGIAAFDEFARGTNPKEGLYLVKALCKFLNMFNSMSLIATHYDGVPEENMTHYQVVGLKNVDFQALKQKIDLNKRSSVEILQQHMDYRLEKVEDREEVPKDALNICRLLGLKNEIIAVAAGEYKVNKGGTK